MIEDTVSIQLFKEFKSCFENNTVFRPVEECSYRFDRISTNIKDADRFSIPEAEEEGKDYIYFGISVSDLQPLVLTQNHDVFKGRSEVVIKLNDGTNDRFFLFSSVDISYNDIGYTRVYLRKEVFPKTVTRIEYE